MTPIPGSDLAYVAEWSKYAMERSIGRPGADLYLQDIRTGERTLLKENLNDRYVQASPGGQYLLFMEDGHFWTIDLATREIRNITESAPVSFIDQESDQTSKVYPGSTAEAALRHRPVGRRTMPPSSSTTSMTSGPYHPTDPGPSGSPRCAGGGPAPPGAAGPGPGGRGGGGGGAASSSPEDEWIDLEEPRLPQPVRGVDQEVGLRPVSSPEASVERLVWLDKNVGSLAKAEEADVFGYMAQAYDDSPDIFVGGPDLSDARQVTETNPVPGRLRLGPKRADRVRDRSGTEAAGLLDLPGRVRAGKKYPMIVYNYELLSQNVHRYVAPSDRSYYNTSVSS